MEKKIQYKNTSVRLPVDMYKQLEAEAASIERPVNWLIVNYIKTGLKYYEPKKPEEANTQTIAIAAGGGGGGASITPSVTITTKKEVVKQGGKQAGKTEAQKKLLESAGLPPEQVKTFFKKK